VPEKSTRRKSEVDLIKTLTKEQLKPEVPVLNIGDTVRVHNRIKEGNRERVQIFEGTIIAKRGGGISQTFTVRRISYGVGVEKTFPVHSPNVEKVEIIRSGKVRRAKLYYLRGRVGKRSKVKEQLFVASSANSNAGTNSVEENTVETSSEE
jgi:large subunit ribosomal protein L19